MMKTGVSMLAVCLSAALSGTAVSSIAISQDAATARVTVTYNLDVDAIVTLDMTTNGVSIGAANMRCLVGDVNRLVAAGTGKSICWFPADAFPDNVITNGSLAATVTAWSPENPPEYLVCDLSVTNGISYYVAEEALPCAVTNDIYKTTHLVMRRIHATGHPWRMGSPVQKEKGDINDTETTVSIPHIVVLTNDYWIGVYPVTQRQYYLLTGGFRDGGIATAGFKSAADAAVRPMENISFEDIRGSANEWPANGHAVSGALLKMRALTGLAYLDLPTEAQWEYACRAGTGSAYNSGKECTTDRTSGTGCNAMAEVGWYGGNADNYGNSDKHTHPVGLKLANRWGLYDFHGNVWERCLDWYATGTEYSDTFADGWATGVPTIEPVGPANGTHRVVRGGDWFSGPLYARSCYRHGGKDITLTNNRSDKVGFRLACVIGK